MKSPLAPLRACVAPAAFATFLAFTACVTQGAEAAPAATAPAPATSLGELKLRLESHLMQAGFSNALWGVKVVSLDSGQTLFEHHPERFLSPASNCKLYTAAMALDRLGGDYRIVTPIFATAKPGADGVLRGDVIVSGRGDPSWKSRGGKGTFADLFAPFVAALRTAGVKHIAGDLVADATWLNTLPNGLGWTADDLNDYYGAEISALSLEDNYAELRVTPAKQAGAPAITAMLQPHTGLVIDNRVKTTAKGGRRRIESTRLIGENVVHVFGELPVGDREETLDITVPRPAAWFAAALKDALVQAGIAVDGAPRALRWPDVSPVKPDAVKLGEIKSPPLRELIIALMKPSQNLETELIFEHVGELTRTPDTPPERSAPELGVLALKAFLKKHNLPADDVRFEEGSGLSRNNLATANATVALLSFMTKHAEAKTFDSALPVAGVDGSLRRRMKNTPAAGNVHAKTGTLRYANSLSGYVTTAAGEHLAFSLMVNRNVAPAGRTAREELDDVAVMLASYTGHQGS